MVKEKFQDIIENDGVLGGLIISSAGLISLFFGGIIVVILYLLNSTYTELFEFVLFGIPFGASAPFIAGFLTWKYLHTYGNKAKGLVGSVFAIVLSSILFNLGLYISDGFFIGLEEVIMLFMTVVITIMFGLFTVGWIYIPTSILLADYIGQKEIKN